MHDNSKPPLGLFIAISFISCVFTFLGQTTAQRWRTVPSCRSPSVIRRWMRYLHHRARWQELKRSEWLVILWEANARTTPTAVLDSVGPAE